MHVLRFMCPQRASLVPNPLTSGVAGRLGRTCLFGVVKLQFVSWVAILDSSFQGCCR